MEQDPEEQAIIKWLRMVDKPLTTKEEKAKKDTTPSDEADRDRYQCGNDSG